MNTFVGCTPILRLMGALQARRLRVVGRGPQWIAQCPAHEDIHPSLSIRETEDGRVLVHCYAGCRPGDIVAALGMTLANLSPVGALRRSAVGERMPRASPQCASSVNKSPPRVYPTIEAAVRCVSRQQGVPISRRWNYHHAQGQLFGAVGRWDRPGGGKEIRPFRRLASGWIIGRGDDPWPLYRLPEILAADPQEPIVICEGEKAADAARQCELVATTSAGGAQAAHRTDWGPIKGRRMIILPDNDEAGERYATTVVEILTRVGCNDVRILRLADFAPWLPLGGDLADVWAAPDRCGLPVRVGAKGEDIGEWILRQAQDIPIFGTEAKSRGD